jgi:twitching motility two-component system response regulator PilH
MERLTFRNLFARRSQSQERRSRPRVPKTRVLKVLVVDDSRTVVHGLRTMLEQDGYMVLEAYDGNQATEMAHSHRPDLIIMDVVMPGLNGFQATRKIRKDPATHNIPIIIISGTEQPTEQFWLTKLGANDFLGKPVVRGDLFTKVESQLQPTSVVA